MTKKIISIIVVFLATLLIVSNMTSIANLYAQTNNINSSTAISPRCKLERVEQLQVCKKTSNCIKLEWNCVEGADGYRVYRSSMKNGIYRRVVDINSKTTRYIDTSLDCGTNYYYKVRAYKKVGDKICVGCYSQILEVSTCPEVVKCLQASIISNSSIELSWQTIYKSSGYEVYRATSENGNYTRVAMPMDNGKSCYIDNNLKSGHKYYYKIRAFKELNGKVCFGEFSEVLSICIKK